MEVQRSQPKLTRTHSSLLRSSPTAHSSIQSFPSVDEATVDLEEQKPHTKPCTPLVRSNAACFTPFFPVLLLLLYTLITFFIWEDVSPSENLLSALIFVAVLLFLVSKNKKILGEYARKMGLSCFASRSHTKPVQWFIGDSDMDRSPHDFSCINIGVEFYSNGDFYEGEFHRGRCNGSGVYNYIVKGRYEGDWVDGKYDGYGIERWAKGSKYKGQYRQGLRHGFGVYKFYTGDTYAGEWFNGQSHGIGVQTCADGSCYIGEFKCGVKHGLGCYHFRNGDRYGGEYFADKPHGFGVYHFANGHVYEGSWHEGQKQGYGMYIFRNGEMRCGEWDRGSRKTSLSQDLVIQVVQAARKKADNAIHLRRVDEKVNMAASAANKAATAARVAAVKAAQNRIHGYP